MARLSKPQAVIALIFLFLLILRIPGLTNSPAEYHGWRQSDTEAMARNFNQYRFNILYPQLNYDGPQPNYAQLEFPVTPFLIAAVYRLFGESFMLARLVPLLFFAGSAYYLYLLGKELAGELFGRLALLAYGIFPFCVFFSRAIMPEPAALFFMLSGLYYFLIWQKAPGKRGRLLLSAGLLALGISQKIPAAYIGLPIGWVFLQRKGLRAIVSLAPWSFALLALLPPFLFFAWLKGVAETDYVSGIAANLLLPGWVQGFWSPAAASFLSQALLRAYTPMGLGLAFGGLLLLDWQRDRFLLIWATAAALEVVLVAAVIQLDYYLLLTAPVVALLAAAALRQLWGTGCGRMMLVGFLLAMVLLGWQVTGLCFQEEEQLLKQARIIEESTGSDDLLVIGRYSPELLNLSHRYGWRANIFFPGDPQKELEYFTAGRAAYFVVVQGQIEGDPDGSYYNYLRENYREIFLGEDLSLFPLGSGESGG